MNIDNNWLYLLPSADSFYQLSTYSYDSYYQLSTLLTQQSTYKTNPHQIKPTMIELQLVEALKKTKELNLWVRCAFVNVEYGCSRV